MNLKEQIISLIFSFLYGMLFSVLVNINYNFLFSKDKKIKITITLLFIIDMSLLYFLILNYLNNGVIHIYFLLLILLGFYSTFSMGKVLRKLKPKEKSKKDK